MLERFEKYLNWLLTFFLLEGLLLVLGSIVFSQFYSLILLVLLIINGVFLLVFWAYYRFDLKSRIVGIQTVLGKEAPYALEIGNVGLVTLDHNFVIVWMSEIFDDSMTRFIGEKVTSWIPETSQLIRGNKETIVAPFKKRIYEITRLALENTLVVKDVTSYQTLSKQFRDDKTVLGLLHLDNYEEETQYEDEEKTAMIDHLIRSKVLNWAKESQVLLRRVRADRYFMVLNEKDFQALKSKDFSILDDIRTTSQDHDLTITVSLAFARGTNDLMKLEELSNRALELTQGRGGDQVAVNTLGQEIDYYGLGSQAKEKSSMVRVRIMSHTLAEMIYNSENVVIVGHKTMDFDCLGAALGMSNIVAGFQRPVAIVTKTGGIEEKLEAVYLDHYQELSEKHLFLSEEEALEWVKPSSLVIMLDHHDKDQTNSPNLLEKVRKIAIVDHHRRLHDFDFNPILAYIETACSSASEMVTELFSYQRHAVELLPIEANIMYAGIVIDTNHFVLRTGSRTFEAVSRLRQLGADPQQTEEYFKLDYDEFELKAQLLSHIQRIEDVALVAFDQKPVSRTMISSVADQLLKVNEIEAAIVIAPLDHQRVGVSARSKENTNVQVLMEKLGGGGHFNMAAYQSDRESVAELHEKIVALLEKKEASE